jgi:competence protein ComEA
MLQLLRRFCATVKPRAIRRLDQAGIAALGLVALITLAGYWFAHGGHRGSLIEIERAEPRPALFQVDLNSANWPELAQLPGVGETLARRIVQSRQEHGNFTDHDDLRRVRGIGPRTLERLKPYFRPIPAGDNVAGG